MRISAGQGPAAAGPGPGELPQTTGASAWPPCRRELCVPSKHCLNQLTCTTRASLLPQEPLLPTPANINPVHVPDEDLLSFIAV